MQRPVGSAARAACAATPRHRPIRKRDVARQPPRSLPPRYVARSSIAGTPRVRAPLSTHCGCHGTLAHCTVPACRGDRGHGVGIHGIASTMSPRASPTSTRRQAGCLRRALQPAPGPRNAPARRGGPTWRASIRSIRMSVDSMIRSYQGTLGAEASEGAGDRREERRCEAWDRPSPRGGPRGDEVEQHC